MEDLTYPNDPGFKESSTSKEAALSMSRESSRLRILVLGALYRPMTADECADTIGMSVLSIRPRFTELHRDGAIEETGELRHNRSGRRAKVWQRRAV
jgi:predicted ArsR family transcriptional regulator